MDTELKLERLREQMAECHKLYIHYGVFRVTLEFYLDGADVFGAPVPNGAREALAFAREQESFYQSQIAVLVNEEADLIIS